MKKLFLLFAAALMSASMFAQPATVPTVTDLADAGYDLTGRVICLYFDEQVCNDIVWAGSYNEWSTTPVDMMPFEPLDGYDGWYVIELWDDSDPCQGRPVQLKNDGSFSWDFQSGDPEAWINMAQPFTKTATIGAGSNPDESNCTWPTTGAYIYEVAYFKNHNTPCGAPVEYKYTEYENWQIKYGNRWEWSDNMEKVEDGLFKLEVLWEGTGFNVKSDANPIKKDWFAPEELVLGEEVIAPVTVDVYLQVIDDETMKIGIGVIPVTDLELTAPQVPTVDAANVKAIMCETYNNDLGYWPQGWGGCNWVDTCRAGVNIKYANTMAWDCFASDWQGAGVADYANLHFDIWFAEDGNAPIIKLEFNGTDPTAEITIPGEYKAGWNSVNINVKDVFGEQPMDNLKCLTVKVTKEGGPVAWANILFFNGEYTSQVSTGYCGDAPAECKYTEYENWQIKFGPDWTWSDNMTKVEDGLFKMEIEWDGTGFNIKSDENPIKQDWFPVEELVIGEEVIAPVIVDVYLKVIDDEHIRIGIGTNPGVGPTDAINIINTEDIPNGAIIKDGKVYIIRNGKLYNLQGSEIKNADEILKSIQF